MSNKLDRLIFTRYLVATGRIDEGMPLAEPLRTVDGVRKLRDTIGALPTPSVRETARAWVQVKEAIERKLKDAGEL